MTTIQTKTSIQHCKDELKIFDQNSFNIPEVQMILELKEKFKGQGKTRMITW